MKTTLEEIKELQEQIIKLNKEIATEYKKQSEILRKSIELEKEIISLYEK